MPKIAEKLGFMKGRAVKVCAKARIRRKVRHKKRVLVQIFKKMSRNRKFLIVQGKIGKFIDLVQGNYVFKACKWEISVDRCPQRLANRIEAVQL
jgi:hypothetical protein